MLVIHPGALGDVLLARPVLRMLRHQFPQHEIAILSGKAVGALLRDGAEIERVFPLESTHLGDLFAGLDGLCVPFRTWLGDCDIAVGWLRDTEGTVATTLRDAGVQSTNLKSAWSSDLRAEHQSGRYLEAIQMNGEGQVVDYPLVLSTAIREQGRQILQALNWNNRQPLVVIHAGSGSARKCAEAWRLARVVEQLFKVGMAPMLLEGPADHELVAQVLSALATPVPVIRGLNLSMAAAVMAQAALYLGHDSGVTHVAAALAVPTIACFGPTNPRRWAPLGSVVSIVSGAPCICPTWSDVEGCQERVCLQIAPERITEACRARLGT